MRIKIINGLVIDPARGENGTRRDVCVADGKIVWDAGDDARIIDAKGRHVLPGMIDIHTHFTNPAARKLRETWPDSPVAMTPAELGETYARMGYSLIVDPAVSIENAMRAREDMASIPYVDKLFLIIVPQTPEILSMIEKKESARLTDYLGKSLDQTGAYGIKLVNPGGVYLPEKELGADILKTGLSGFDITAGDIVVALADAAESLHLPHPLHLHMNNLGNTRSCETAIETIRTLDGRQVHLAHLQFYAYGEENGRLVSQSARLMEVVNRSANVTFDVGQIVFGETVTETYDDRLTATLRKIVGGGVDVQAGGETCYLTPYNYSRESYINSVQWATGLEIMLLADDPWRGFLSMDHPNGGAITAYPHIWRLLMDKECRRAEMENIHKDVRERSLLREMGREYSVHEMSIITSAGIAKRLGLADRGTLAIGSAGKAAMWDGVGLSGIDDSVSL